MDQTDKLMIPRLEDLPYWTSPPVQFVYRSTANVIAGTYTWADPPTILTYSRPVLETAIYYIRNISMSANIDALDYSENLLAIPQFQMYLQSTGKTILFREPVIMAQFFEQMDFRFLWNTNQDNDILYGSFVGSLAQGAGLIGKGSITLTAVVLAQEIVDDSFITLFRQNYPTWNRIQE
jgi:hypothetical protein